LVFDFRAVAKLPLYALSPDFIGINVEGSCNIAWVTVKLPKTEICSDFNNCRCVKVRDSHLFNLYRKLSRRTACEASQTRKLLNLAGKYSKGSSKISAATNLLFVENAVDDAEFAAAHFFVAVFDVEMLGADEDDGGVQVQKGVAEFLGAFFQRGVDGLAETLPLKVGMDTHSFYFGSIRGGSPKCSHGDDTVFERAEEEFAESVQVDSFDLVEIGIKSAAVDVSAGGEQGRFVQFAHGGVVGWLIAANR
jgi:hypothetical protein